MASTSPVAPRQLLTTAVLRRREAWPTRCAGESSRARVRAVAQAAGVGYARDGTNLNHPAPPGRTPGPGLSRTYAATPAACRITAATGSGHDTLSACEAPA